MIRNILESRHSFRAVIVFLLTVVASPGGAQSPFKLNWSLDGPLLGVSATALGLTRIAIGQNDALTVQEVEALDPANINRFDRPAVHNYSVTLSKVSDAMVGLLLIMPAGLMTSERIRKDAWTVGTMYAEALILANLGPQIFKATTPRVRPYAYNQDVPMSEKLTVKAKESFFSGHTSNAFASATFLSSVYSAYYPDSKLLPYIWVGSLSLAGIVGYLRYSSGKHFPTDILTGALWGSAAGLLIPCLHRSEHDTGIGWNPVIGNEVIGGSVRISF